MSSALPFDIAYHCRLRLSFMSLYFSNKQQAKTTKYKVQGNIQYVGDEKDAKSETYIHIYNEAYIYTYIGM